MSDPRRRLAELIEAHRAELLGPFFSRLARASVAAGALSITACSATHHAAPDAGAGRVDAFVASPPLQDAGGLSDGSPEALDAGLAPSDARPSDAGRPRYTPPLCEDSRWRAVHGLSLPSAPDYLDAFANDFGSRVVVDSIGTSCGGASEVEACNSALAATESSFGRALRVTDGDIVERLSSEVEVVGLLGSIDTPQEALLRVWMAGYTIYCGDATRHGVREVDGSYEVLATRMVSDCDPILVNAYELKVRPDGGLTVLSERELERIPGACVGRRPAGLRATAPTVSADPSAGWLAEIAHLEAAAVDAFRVLARELEAEGAPPDLVMDALAAAEDEVRHADVIGRLARERGACGAAPKVEARPLRSLFAMALDNATEGCVRETFGALVGHRQALAAEDSALREAMATIADDETRHASLSWRIARWIEPRLTDAERRAVTRAREAALVALRAESARAIDPRLARAVGLPAPAEARALLDVMESALFA